MGAWGFLSDENDLTQDYVMDIQKAVLPKELKSCYKHDINESYDCKLPEEKVKALKAKLQKQIGKDLGMMEWHDLTSKPEKCNISATTPKTVQCVKDKRHYMADHPEQVLTALKKLKINKEHKDDVVAGIALFLARAWHTTPIMPDKWGTVKRGYELPTLPPNHQLPGCSR